ncbi:MAG: hypothetical protein IJP84_05380 [Lachnospiraceae bacterium]|nr:hypothetical protein [Lachnospiraceae bacterium]
MDNNEIKLIKTVDMEKKSTLVRMLVNAGISYLEKWERVPFFSRKEFDGAKEACVIYVNENQKERALEILEAVENGEGSPVKHKQKIKALMDGEE